MRVDPKILLWMGAGVVLVALAWPRRAKASVWPSLVGAGGLTFGVPTTQWWRGDVVPFMQGANQTQRNLAEYARQVARQEGIPESGLPFQLWIESRFRDVESPVGARGVGQFMPLTGQEYGLVTGVTSSLREEYQSRYRGASASGKLAAAHWLMSQPGVTDNRDDARASIDAAARYMKHLYDRLGNWAHAVAAYNCGRGCVQNRLDRGTKLPNETQKYVTMIGPYYEESEAPHLVSSSVKADYPWPGTGTALV